MAVALFAIVLTAAPFRYAGRIATRLRVGQPTILALVNDQLDAQFLYFIIRLLQPSTCFEQRRAHHQEVKLY